MGCKYWDTDAGESGGARYSIIKASIDDETYQNLRDSTRGKYGRFRAISFVVQQAVVSGEGEGKGGKTAKMKRPAANRSFGVSRYWF